MEADDFRSRLVPGADLRGITFPHFDNLNGIDLHGADLRGANLCDVTWWRDGCELYHANLSGVDLRGAELGIPTLDGTNLRGANLSGLHTSYDQFAKASFEGADLTEADLSGVNLDGASFDGAVLDGANLVGAVLTSCTFRGASLCGTDLTRTALPGDLSAFAGARFDSSTQWSEHRRAETAANSVAGPDGVHVINSPPPPAPTPPVPQPSRIGTVVGRVAAFLFGTGITVYAVLYAMGNVDLPGSFGPDPSVSDRVMTCLLLCFGSLGLVGGGLFGFPESSSSSGGHSSGAGEFDDYSCGCGIDAD